MNGDILKPPPSANSDGSRIPVASPRSGSNGFRRSSSMRLRGEKRPSALRLHGGSAASSSVPFSRDSCPPPDLLLAEGAALQARPQHLDIDTTAHKNKNLRPRTRSLSLSTGDDSHQCNGHGHRPTHQNAIDIPGAGRRPMPISARSHNQLNHLSYANDIDLDSCCDLDSVRSFASSSANGMPCDHPHVPQNGTTFSGRRMRYVVHCSAHAGQVGEDYLTPTQRAQRQIKRLKHMLGQAKQDLELKDSDIFRLTKEVVELRLYKASLNSPESSSEAITVRENATEDMKTPESPTCTDFTDDPRSCNANMHSSCADSGHFEDLGIGSTHSGDDSSRHVETSDKACLARLESPDEKRLIEEYEKRLEELVRTHADETHALKHAHTERVEELLEKLSEVNLRYSQLVPDLEQARERIHDLEKQLDELNAQLQQQQDAKNSAADGDKMMAVATHNPSRVSVSELLQQLQVTRNELDNIRAMYRTLVESKSKNMDPEVTLQFLKSAIYYFLTDKENHHGHLRAIQSILGFSPTEISNIDRARNS